MLHRRQRFAAENLLAAAFGDVRGEALDAPQFAVDAPASLTLAAVVAADAAPVTAAAVSEATPVAAAAVGIPPASLSPAAIVIDDSPPGFSPRAEGRGRSAEVTRERWLEKRPRVEVPPCPSSPPPVEETPLSPPLVTWRPDVEAPLGRPLAVTNRTGTNPNVVVALGRACALPLDMAKWETMDDASLMVSTMRSAVTVNIWHKSLLSI